MDLSFLLKIAGVGIIVAVSCQVLSKLGRDEQATMVSIAGIIVAFLMVSPCILLGVFLHA